MEQELKRLKGMVDEEQTEDLVKNLMQRTEGGINEEELELLKQEIRKIEIEVNEAKKFKIGKE